MHELQELVRNDTKVKHYRPYEWYKFDPIDWMLLAEHGVAVEYLPNGAWQWCTRERALVVAKVPLRMEEYKSSLEALLKI